MPEPIDLDKIPRVFEDEVPEPPKNEKEQEPETPKAEEEVKPDKPKQRFEPRFLTYAEIKLIKKHLDAINERNNYAQAIYNRVKDKFGDYGDDIGLVNIKAHHQYDCETFLYSKVNDLLNEILELKRKDIGIQKETQFIENKIFIEPRLE